MRNPLFLIIPLLVAQLCTSCNGIFNGIYDSIEDEYIPEDMPYGFKRIDADKAGGTIFVNATSYTRWTYFNLREFSADTLDFSNNSNYDDIAKEEPTNWDFAVHRSAPKTNGGSAAETPYFTIKELEKAVSSVGGIDNYVQEYNISFDSDAWTTDIVSIDMTNVLQGDVVFLHTLVNTTLNKWLKIDYSNPPPTYTPSNKVYILKLKSEEYYALHLNNFRNNRNTTAWLTIEFRKLQ